MRYFRGHTGFVQALAFSPDGLYLASAGSEGTVGIWDVISGNLVRWLPVDDDWACAVTFSPDGEQVLACSYDGIIRVWNVATGQPLEANTWDDQGRLTAAAWSADGRYLAWSSYDGGAVFYANEDQSLVQSFADSGRIYTLRIAPDSRTIATGGSGPSIVLRRLPTRTISGRLDHKDEKGCWSLAFSPNGHWLAAGLGSSVQIWDHAAHRLAAQFAEHDDIASSVAMTPDGSRLLTGSWDRTVRLYELDLESGRPGRLLGSHDWEIGKVFDVTTSPDGMLAAASGDQEPFLIVWDLE